MTILLLSYLAKRLGINETDWFQSMRLQARTLAIRMGIL